MCLSHSETVKPIIIYLSLRGIKIVYMIYSTSNNRSCYQCRFDCLIVHKMHNRIDTKKFFNPFQIEIKAAGDIFITR